MREPTWAVVATVDEPSPLIISFVAHYLAQGASEVHLYLDRANPVAQAALAGLEGLHMTLCDAAHWQRFGARPEMHIRRQSHNANAAYAKTKADFLLHCDCDEYLRDGPALRAALAALPADTTYLQLQVGERVYKAGVAEGDIFDGLFRHPIDLFHLIGEDIFGEDVKFMRSGLTGHKIGKAVVRCGLDLHMRLHIPKGDWVGVDSPAGWLLHFDGLTRLHYTLKLMRRMAEPPAVGRPRHGRSRIEQMLAVSAQLDSARTLAARVKSLTPDQFALLDGMGYLDHRSFDPRPALARLGFDLDLSAQAFDAELYLRDAAFMAECGMTGQV